MYYQFYEWNQAFLTPARVVNDAVRLAYKNPLNPLAHTELGRQIAAAGDVFERLTRRYGKPEFDLTETVVDGRVARVSERIVWERPFCRLVHFHRSLPQGSKPQPNLLIVAPMSGHYATLLRGTVEAFLPHHEVFITDWVDARMVPIALGNFDLDDYIDYVIDMIQLLDGDVHLVAVCQPAVPVFAATAILEQRQSMSLPKSITLMGGPIDARENPTEVNTYAGKHDLDWFRRNVIMTVPFPHPGVMRRVYPGFLQLTGFMTMNLDRHLTAHYDYFDHLVRGDGDSAEKHRAFYDEYLSVMDLTEEFYLQTVDTVFLRHALPEGEMRHRGRKVDPGAITRTPILTVEGELDDISGLGQTKAAHRLTPNLPAEKHAHYEQAAVGHYGVFNGSRFRSNIAPRISAFIARWDERAGNADPSAYDDMTLAPWPEAAAGEVAAKALGEPTGEHAPSAETLSEPTGGHGPSGEASGEPTGGHAFSAETLSEPIGGHALSAETLSEPAGGRSPSGEALGEPTGGHAPSGEALGEPTGGHAPSGKASGEPAGPGSPDDSDPDRDAPSRPLRSITVESANEEAVTAATEKE